MYNSLMHLELNTAQQQNLLDRALRYEDERLLRLRNETRPNSPEYQHLTTELQAIEGLFINLHNKKTTFVEVGEADSMPGTNGGFTMASFNGKQVPVGSKVFAKVPR